MWSTSCSHFRGHLGYRRLTVSTGLLSGSGRHLLKLSLPRRVRCFWHILHCGYPRLLPPMRQWWSSVWLVRGNPLCFRELVVLHLAGRHFLYLLEGLRRPQTVDICYGQGNRAMVSSTAAPRHGHLRVYDGHSPHGEEGRLSVLVLWARCASEVMFQPWLLTSPWSSNTCTLPPPRVLHTC